eukprot:jgi/Tetstr1/460305/TSEL_005605.t1
MSTHGADGEEAGIMEEVDLVGQPADRLINLSSSKWDADMEKLVQMVLPYGNLLIKWPSVEDMLKGQGEELAGVYNCASHVNCPAHLRMCRDPVSKRWEMQRDHRLHTQQEVDVVVDGKVRNPKRVNKAQMKEHVDDAPMRLVEKLATDDKKIADARAWRLAFKGWKKSLTRAEKGPRAYESIADLRDWARRNEMPLLHSADSDAALEDDKLVVLQFCDEAKGVVFTTLGMFRTLRLAETGNLPLCLVTGGTHNIHYGKWVLLTLGAHSIEYDMEKYSRVHSFRPISFCFAQEEDRAAMTLMFKATMDTHKKINNITEGWHNAAKNAFPKGLRNPTDSLMEKHFPKWLEDETSKRSTKHINHAFSMELSTDIHFAVDYLQAPGSHMEVDGALYLVGDPFKIGTRSVTRPAVLKYRNSLAGSVGSRPRWTIQAIERDFLFMNRVTLHNGRPRCDCERFWLYGICSHKLLWGALRDPTEKMRLERLEGDMSDRPGKHRPRGPTAALVRQPQDSGNASQRRRGHRTQGEA